MRGVGGDRDEERFILVLLDELQRLAKPHVSAVSRELFPIAVVLVVVVEVVVCPVVLNVANSTTTINEDFIEPAILWAERIVVAEVPLSEQRGLVAAGLECIGNGCLIALEQRSPSDRRPHSVLERWATGQKHRTGRCAIWLHVEIGEANALAV